MGLTEFGKAVRKARIDANVTLGSMADTLEVTAAFLSALETGRKKIPADMVGKIAKFFKSKGIVIPQLDTLASVANKSVSLEGLNHRQQMLVAGFARSSLDAETLQKLAKLLDTVPSKGAK